MRKIKKAFKNGTVIDKIFIIIAPIILILGIIGIGKLEPIEEEKNVVIVKEEQVEEKNKETDEEKKSEEEKATEEVKKEETPLVIERENIVGTSSKNFTEIDKSKPSTVRNDVTGNWRLTKIVTTENIIDYALSYYKNNFKDDKEIHAIVNFTLNTTTKISKMTDNMLSVTIHEYVDKEEHDAKKLFGGMALEEYFIYIDNGDVEKLY